MLSKRRKISEPSMICHSRRNPKGFGKGTQALRRERSQKSLDCLPTACGGTENDKAAIYRQFLGARHVRSSGPPHLSPRIP